jgi:NAD+ synthase (glutamine-hydrolysing)
MRALGTSGREIPIGDAVLQHFRDIGHDPNVHDVTYENAQARERTQILMDGWATFNGDHMSMYHVNAGVPKTLVRYMIAWSADEVFSGDVAAVLRDIADTPITPELLPLRDGQLQQRTEETIGPYVLHDFFLFNHVRYGFPPRKVFYLARQAFANTRHPERGGMTTANGAQSRDDDYNDATILKWLAVFYSRFFSQQFKRSAMPDGPKVGSVALSPRGDWRMPSDARSELWQEEVERIRRTLVPVAHGRTKARRARA